MSWGSSGSWGIFGLGNLVVPGSGVHVLNSLGTFLPVSSFFLELSSGTGGVLEVFLEGLFDLEIELVSLVEVIINLRSDQLSFLLLNISNERFWLWFWKVSNGFVKVNASFLVSLEFCWPGGLSGFLEGSFLGSNGSLVSDPVFLELLSSFDISGLSISPFVNDDILVVNLERPFSGFSLGEFDLAHFVVVSISVSFVDGFLLLDVGLDLSGEFFSLVNGIVGESFEILNDGLIHGPSGFPGLGEAGFDLSFGGKRFWCWGIEVIGKV